MRVEIKCQGASDSTIEELIEFQGPLKSLSKIDYDKFKAQLLEIGFCEPITVWSKDGKLLIANGHQRLRVLSKMKFDGIEIPSIPISFVFPKDESEFARIVLSLCSQYGAIEKEGMYEYCAKHNIPVQYLEERLRLPELDLPKYKAEFFEDKYADKDTDETPEPRATDIKLGDLFILGNHRLLCGDSTDAASVERLMNGERADMVFTDPPYNIAENCKGVAGGAPTNKQSKKLMEAEWDKNFEFNPVSKSIEALIAEDATVYICTSQFVAPEIWAWMDSFLDYSGYCVWTKPNPFPSLMKRRWAFCTELICYGTRGKQVFNYPSSGNALSAWNIAIGEGGLHPTQKPVGVSQHAIEHSSKENQIIADLFLGSGSTLIACEKTNRRCFGMEIDPQYVQVIIDRWEKFTGLKAEKSI